MGTAPAAIGKGAEPFVGPRHFERDEQELFFGRSAEIRMLESMVLANRVTLLYSLSGAGKTSLLHAGVVPALESEHYFEVLPPARVGGPGTGTVADAANPFVAGLLADLRPAGSTMTETLAELLASRPHDEGPDGYPRPRALVVDQLEELFVLHPERWEERSAVFEQLTGALAADPLLRVILAIREDYLAQLEPYRRLLPNRLEARLRLELLDPKAAEEAVAGPLLRTGRSFVPGVVERLVADLRKTSLIGDGGELTEFESEYVEPLHLQLSCSALVRELPPDVTEITGVHASSLANVERVLTELYEEAIGAASRAAGMDEGELRRRFAATFITTMNTRGTAYRSGEHVGSVPVAAVHELEERRLVRAEWRANARWFELTHDRMIGPVRRSNLADAERRTKSETRRLRRRSSRLLTALFAVSALAIGLVIYAWDPGALRRLELSSIDQRFELRGSRAPDPRLVMVDFDDASVAQAAETGHLRREIADVLDRIVATGPRIVAADMIFDIPRKPPQDDRALRDVIMRAGPRLVLAFDAFSLARPSDGPAVVRPTLFVGAEDLEGAEVGVGYAGLPEDPGRILRRVDYSVTTEGPAKTATFASTVARQQLGAERSADAPRASRRAWADQTRETTWIDYSGQQFPTVSFADVAAGRVPAEFFRDKVVVVGAHGKAGGDAHATPVAPRMAGPAIQAEAISTLLRGAPLRDAPVPVDLALVALMAFAPLAAMRFRSLPFRLLAVFGAGAALVIAAQVAFNAGHVVSVVLPLGVLLISLAATLLVPYGRR